MTSCCFCECSGLDDFFTDGIDVWNSEFYNASRYIGNNYYPLCITCYNKNDKRVRDLKRYQDNCVFRAVIFG